MKIRVTLGQSNKVVYINTDATLSLDEILLMVADQYGDEWYGCSINKETGDFLCNAVKSYFDRNPEYAGKSVYEIALHSYVTNLKIKKGFRTYSIEDEDTTVITAKDNIFEEE